MKTKRSTNRSFPGRLTLEEWLDLPSLGRRDMVCRAECELLGGARFCPDRMCRRNRTCCGDDSMACERRLWQLPEPRPKALRRQLGRLEKLRALPGPGRETLKTSAKSALWTAMLREPWNAPSYLPGNPPWATAPGPARQRDRWKG